MDLPYSIVVIVSSNNRKNERKINNSVTLLTSILYRTYNLTRVLNGILKRRMRMEHNVKEQLETINQQIKELVGVYRGIVSRSGISENEFWIWYSLIIMEGEYSQRDICNSWSLSKQTVNTIVTHMVERGMAFLEVVPGTRNRKIIRLTETGKKYGESIVRSVSEAENRAFNRLPEADRLAWIVAFRKYINILKEEIHGTENK